MGSSRRLAVRGFGFDIDCSALNLDPNDQASHLLPTESAEIRGDVSADIVNLIPHWQRAG
jgi:hypothetical protein